MTTSAEVRAAWKTKVFDQAALQAITGKGLFFDPLQDLSSTTERKLVTHATETNFFHLTVHRTRFNKEIKGTGTDSRHEFTVRAFYTIEKNPGVDDRRFNGVVDALEAMDDLVRSSLGKTWNSTVDFYEMVAIQETQILVVGDLTLWRGGYQYRAVKQI